MTATLRGRIGFEIELLAPRGSSRRTLADEIASRSGGTVRPVWHHDSEPSLVPGLGRFLRLSQGFEVRRADGELLCTLVDDITLLADLDPRRPAPPGWFRILGDDARLLRLLALHSDPGADAATALDEAARLWRTTAQQLDDVYRLDDPSGVTIALAAPQGGERERGCEVVTAPLTADHHAELERLLAPARELGFTVPHEAAVHLHLDGGPFREAHAAANVVRLFAHWREPLRQLLGTNPACLRLAPLPAELVRAVEGTPTWADLREAADAGGLTKYFDVNLTQLFSDTPVRDTVEVRILPGAIDADDIVNQAGVVELLLERCRWPEPIGAAPDDPGAAVQELIVMAADVLAARP
ncbi:amidoligase family protein [Actinoplanes teichomyceticus]|uniref:Putative amidoligase enzyme n=1 Tax=Actinoplanes teichomyceticus TaxID=1867 RepID=A0A561WKD3_ACTTI|nr:amidoligase family protein [Actinoplanes teichomyceticus]TWG24325.1 putative amidoligase enzyme [Actinoplanes teichomyceticus]GIF12826.1 hypothetical protein Ate01nite_28580 [Actinoplanes teichomyceticus]